MARRKSTTNIVYKTEIDTDILEVGTLFDKLEIFMRSDECRESSKTEKELNKKLKVFLKRFQPKQILQLKKEEYCLGCDNQQSYCNWIENVLMYGEISGRTNAYQKFVLYCTKNEITEVKEFRFGDKRTKQRKGFGKNVDEIFANVKKHLVNAIEDISNKNYSSFVANPLNPMVKNKIAFLYNSESQIPIYSDDDLNVLLPEFNIPFNRKSDRFYKRALLFDFYKKSGVADLVSPYIFMRFLYSDLGYRYLLRESKTKFAVTEYKLVDVSFNSVVGNKQGTKNRPYVVRESNEEVKRIVGNKGEQIVWDYLQEHAKEMGITELKAWCLDEKIRDDSKGYDFSYVDSSGQTVLIEVKSTKNDYKDEIRFEMSANEIRVMEDNIDSYYVFFINNINVEKTIKRIKASEIKKKTPTHYSIMFIGSIQ